MVFLVAWPLKACSGFSMQEMSLDLISWTLGLVLEGPWLLQSLLAHLLFMVLSYCRTNLTDISSMFQWRGFLSPCSTIHSIWIFLEWNSKISTRCFDSHFIDLIYLTWYLKWTGAWAAGRNRFRFYILDWNAIPDSSSYSGSMCQLQVSGDTYSV